MKRYYVKMAKIYTSRTENGRVAMKHQKRWKCKSELTKIRKSISESK